MSARNALAAIGRLAEFRTAKQRAGDRKRAQKLRGKKKGGVTKKTILKGAGIGLVGGGLLGAGAMHHRIGKAKENFRKEHKERPIKLAELDDPRMKQGLGMLTGIAGAAGAGAGALGGAAIGTGIYLAKRNKNNKKSRKRR